MRRDEGGGALIEGAGPVNIFNPEEGSGVLIRRGRVTPGICHYKFLFIYFLLFGCFNKD